MTSKLKSADVEDTQEPPAALDETTQAMIGSQLKAMYASICDEPIPRHLLDLVKQLEDGKDNK